MSKRNISDDSKQPDKKVEVAPDPAAIRKGRRTNTTTPLKKVAITGGTHGNESNGVFLVKHWMKHTSVVARSNFETITMITNPDSVTANTRYVEEDLNRCCLLADLVSEAKKDSKEGGRALELDKVLGPKASPNPNADFVVDLHNTTANTGVALMLAPDDEFALQVAAYLVSIDPSVTVVQWADVPDWPLLPTLGRSGMTVEVGACPWGVIQPAYYQQTEKLVLAALDYVERHNRALSGGSPTLFTGTVDVYRRIDTVYYPTDDKKEMLGYIHPNLQDKDFQRLEAGTPIFAKFDGTADVCFDASNYSTEVYPIFINEAAYYENRIAFILAQKHQLPVKFYRG